MEWIERRGHLLGTAALGLILLGGYLGLVWSPPDVYQHDVMRIMYLHVPIAWVAELAFLVVLLGSVMYVWKQDLKWDRLAASSAELGVLCAALTIALGSIWAKPIWGVWWTWDPKLTATAVLFVIYAGYLMLRALQPDPITRAKQSAVVGIVGALDLPLIHLSSELWRGLHQGATFKVLQDPTLDDRMEVALLINLAGFTLLYLFLLGRRLRLARLEQQRDELLWEEVQRV
jgi:heme exporter protein C